MGMRTESTVTVTCDDCGAQIEFTGHPGDVDAEMDAAGWGCNASGSKDYCPACKGEEV